MDVDMPSLHKILKDKTRRKIVLKLNEQGSLAYVDLMNILEITNTGKLNYHLKVLGDLLEKDENGKYRLTQKGILASQLLQQFPIEKPVLRKPVTIGDIGLIGFLGFVLIMINPSILSGFFGVAWIRGIWFSILGSLYGFVVPGALMWVISVKRMKTHDLKHLAKPLLFSIVLLVGLVIVIIVIAFLYWFFTGSILRWPPLQIDASDISWIQQSSDGTTLIISRQSVIMGQLSIFLLPFAGVYSYIGLIISEGVYRILR